jgi:hypothetical protein
VFVRNGASWAQQGAALTSSNTQGDDRFGTALALSSNGSILAIGAIGEDSDGTGSGNNSAADAGAAYVFTRSGATWTQQAYIKPSNTQEDDLFGGAVALNAAGNMLAPARSAKRARARASTAIKPTTRARRRRGLPLANNGLACVQSAYIKAPNAEPIDHFGSAVSLSADGTRSQSAPRTKTALSPAHSSSR